MDENEREVLRRTISRERQARKAAECFAEERTRKLYDANKRLEGLAGNLQEIADARTAELRAAKDEAERANAAKTAFLATMSHEMRTPLNVILGMTDLVLDSDLSADQRSLLKRVMANSETLLAIINDILDVSRIEAGELRMNFERFDPCEVVEDVAESLCVQAFGKRLQIVCDIGERVPRAVLGDGQRLRQILLNLGSNAVKFTSSGDVTISTRAVTDDEGVERIEFGVTDSGPGIPADKIDKVFQAFVRLDENGSNKAIPGAGLGLTISQALAAAMGGTVTIESTKGVGSTFVASIPFERTEDAEPQRRAFPRPVKVVLLHSHERTRTVLRRILEQAGANVVDAMSLEALGPPDAVPSDCTWVVDASDKWLQRQGALFRDRKVVLLSDISLRVDELRKLTGANAIVPAPFRAAAICEAVEIANGISSMQRSLRPAHVSSPTTPLRRSRVLVVEDSPDNRKFFRLILEAMGLDVDCVDNGKAGLERFKRGTFDMVVSDLQMPVMDGFQLVRAIRDWEDANQEARTKVVALTADATAGVHEQCAAAGFDEYITKPIARATLEGIVDRNIDRRPAILVVDDSIDQIRLTCKWLSRSNAYQITHVSNGHDAIEAVSKQAVSLVLIDMVMPGMDGYETVRRIRRLENGASIPIVAVTGLSSREAQRECQKAGCSHFLAKPFRDDELLQTVRDVLRATGPRVSALAPETSSLAPDTKNRVAVDADLVDLLPGFFRNRWINLRRMRSLTSQANFAELKGIAHGEKGVGGTYGFSLITELNRKVECACVEGELDKLAEALDEIESYLRGVEGISVSGATFSAAEFE
jgi:signal transduction histidine kinase/CheY-like chemotaxis protein